MHPPPLRYIAILDFEATCDEGARSPTPQEVIEFPTVLLDNETLEIVDAFSSFVQPLHHPTLTAFCEDLTSITQADVDGAELFPEVYAQHLTWLGSHGLSVDDPAGEPSWAFLTCGGWDLATMFPVQCAACVPPIREIPKAYAQWINVKTPFSQWAGQRKAPGMAGMLKAMGLRLDGRHHRGIDDCRNIAQIVRRLRMSGVSLQPNESLATSRYPALRLVLMESSGVAHAVELKRRALPTLHGLAGEVFRRAARDFFGPGAERPLTDQDLLTLPQDSVVRVRFSSK